MLKIHTHRLDNGLLTLTVPMAGLSTAAPTLWFRAGARQETIPGTAHFLEHMAFKGTKTRSARQIAETIENTGGALNAATGHETTHYEARGLASSLAVGAELIADITHAPAFAPQEMARERQVIGQEISEYKNSPAEHVFDLLMQAVFPNQPLGGNILGTPESLAKIDPDILRDYMQRHYTAANGLFTVAGGVKPKEVVALAERLFGGFSAAPPPPAPPPTIFTSGDKREMRDIDQTHLVLAFPAPPAGDDGLLAARIFADSLGGGMASRLFRRIREEMGLCYSISSFLSAFFDTGLLMIYAAAAPSSLPKLLPAIAETIQQAAAGLTEQELNRAKAQMKTALLSTLESPAALADYAAMQFFIRGHVPPMEERVAKIDAVSAADCAAFAHTMLEVPPAMAALGQLDALEDHPTFAARLAVSASRGRG